MSAPAGPSPATLAVHPLTPDRWPDLERLFGTQGAYSGCWCMWWRLPGAAYQTHTAHQRRDAFRAIVGEGRVPGLLAYHEGEPVGWCAIAPRSEFPRFERSRYWKPLDAEPVWSIVCFYVARRQRGQGVATHLLAAAVEYAAAQGARIIEAYPKEPDERLADASVYTGTAAMFRAAGFAEVARRHPLRPLMRRRVGEAAG